MLGYTCLLLTLSITVIAKIMSLLEYLKYFTQLDNGSSIATELSDESQAFGVPCNFDHGKNFLQNADQQDRWR